MRDGGTNQPAPVVHDGTLYLANTGGIVQALDARTGDLIWEHHVGAEVAPRGITLYQSMLILEISGSWAVSPQDGRLIALDARTGETVWNVEMPDVYPTNSGPILANGLLIQGGGTCTVYEETKCSISAYDPATGAQRWRFTHGRARRRARRRQLGRTAEPVPRRRRSVDHGLHTTPT